MLSMKLHHFPDAAFAGILPRYFPQAILAAPGMAGASNYQRKDRRSPAAGRVVSKTVKAPFDSAQWLCCRCPSPIRPM